MSWDALHQAYQSREKDHRNHEWGRYIDRMKTDFVNGVGMLIDNAMGKYLLQVRGKTLNVLQRNWCNAISHCLTLNKRSWRSD